MNILKYLMKEEDAMEKRIYLASDIQKVLGLGKIKTYDFLNQVYRQQGQNRQFNSILQDVCSWLEIIYS